MSHEIDTMAFRGEKPWHYAETQDRSAYVGEEPVGSETMRKAAGLLWEPTLVNVYANIDPKGVRDDLSNDDALVVAPEHRAVVRDDGRGILSVVGKKYTPFHNADLFRVCDALAGEGAVYDTAGSLSGGRRVWALLNIPGSKTLRLRDGRKHHLQPFLLAYNSHDGRSKLRIRTTTVNVVCANTAAMALSGEACEYSVKHTAQIGDTKKVIAEAGEILGFATDSFEEQCRVAQLLADAPMNLREYRGFVCQVLTHIDDEREAMAKVGESEGRSRTMFETKGNELVRLFSSGLGNGGSTLWDGFQSVTEYIDHQRGRSARWRASNAAKGLESAWFGDGEKTKRRALQLLVKRLG